MFRPPFHTGSPSAVRVMCSSQKTRPGALPAAGLRVFPVSDDAGNPLPHTQPSHMQIAGEATRAALTLYADGGTVGGSPGRAIYWSVGTAHQVISREEDPSGRRRWSDEAEFMALLAALRHVEEVCHPGDVGRVVMDCRPLVRHVQTRRRPRCSRLQTLFTEIMDRIRQLADRNIRVVVEWAQRRELVSVLGH
jgi:ribonuclease HI